MVVETGADQEIILPAASGFSSACTITLLNGNNSRAQEISGFPVPSLGCGTACLWPGQAITVMSVSSAWQATIQPGRYINAAATLYVGPSGSCNDNNDGLAASSGGQLCTVGKAVNLLHGYFDTRGTNPTIQVADGAYSETITVNGQGDYQADGIIINGNATTPTNVTFAAPASAAILMARDFGIVFLKNLEISCAASGSSGINASQFATIDLVNVYIGSCDNHTPIEAQDGGHIDFDGGLVIDGNAATIFYANGVGAQVEVESQTVSCIGSLSISSAFAVASDLGEVLAPGLTFAGCGSVTGSYYLAVTNALIQTGGGGATYFPGSTGGSTSTGGLYE